MWFVKTFHEQLKGHLYSCIASRAPTFGVPEICRMMGVDPKPINKIRTHLG